MDSIGFLIFGVAFGILGFLAGASPLSDAYEFISAFQTLISGSFALVAAFWAYHSAIIPVKQSQLEYAQRREIDRRTSYYMLPTSLTIATDQIHSDYDFLADLIHNRNDYIIPHHKSCLGDEITDGLFFIIQNLPHPAAMRVGEVIGQLQVCRARSLNFYRGIENHTKEEIDTDVVYNRMIDLIRANALIESLRNHSRDMISIPNAIDPLSISMSYANITSRKYDPLVRSELQNRINKTMNLTVDLSILMDASR